MSLKWISEISISKAFTYFLPKEHFSMHLMQLLQYYTTLHLFFYIYQTVYTPILERAESRTKIIRPVPIKAV